MAFFRFTPRVRPPSPTSASNATSAAGMGGAASLPVPAVLLGSAAFLLVAALLLPASIAAQGADGGVGEAAAAVASVASLPAPLFTAPPAPAAELAVASALLPRVVSAPEIAPGSDPFALPQQRVRAGPDVALMAVGGAAVVVGLLIGGDGGTVMALGGGVVGLIGLYRYLT